MLEDTTLLCTQCAHAFDHRELPLDSALASLRSNFSPDENETNHILSSIQIVNVELERYVPELVRVQGILASLLEHKARLERYQECCIGLLSPVRKLPTEILQMIFLIGWESSQTANVIPVQGQVCRRWRDIVVGTPELWSRISVGGTRYTFIEHYEDLASLFLDRSISQPLSVSIGDPTDMRLLLRVGEHAPRWHTLAVYSYSRDIYDQLEGLDLDLDLLDKVEIPRTMDPVPEPGERPISLFENAPRLHHVVLKGPSHCWSFPWDQLTRLRYSVSSAQYGVQLVHRCPQLVECTLDMLAEAAGMDLPAINPSRHLRFLRVAVDISTVTQSAEAIMKTVFSCLTTPELVTLEVVGQFAPDDLIEFLTRSDCPLDNLSLGTGYMKPHTLIAVFQAIPGVRRLVLDADIGTTRRLQNRVITAKLLDRLIIYPASDCLLPQLEHLGLTTGLNFEDQTLLDLIESRWLPWATEVHGVPVMRLTSVDLHFPGTTKCLDPTSVQVLKDLFEAGLCISLKQGGTQVSLQS